MKSYRKQNIIVALLLCCVTLLSCNTTTKKCGADKDTHGCIGSAGYVWSEILQECVRPWETGSSVAVPKKEGDSYTKEYHIVFNADGTQAELLGIGILRPSADGTWESEDGNIKVVKTDDGFAVEE